MEAKHSANFGIRHKPAIKARTRPGVHWTPETEEGTFFVVNSDQKCLLALASEQSESIISS